jgi:hypothetical protein
MHEEVKNFTTNKHKCPVKNSFSEIYVFLFSFSVYGERNEQNNELELAILDQRKLKVVC